MSAISAIGAVTSHTVSQKRVKTTLSRAEWILLGIAFATGIAAYLAAAARNQAVDWPGFLPAIGFNLELVLIGILIRRTRHLGRTAMCLIALGLNGGFSACSGIFIFTVLPFSNPMVDQQLMAADAVFGFSWLKSVTYLAQYPIIAFALRFVYLSLIPQLLFVIIFLSFLKCEVALHRLLMVGFLSFTAMVGIWWLFPSVGPAAYGMVSEEVQNKVFLIANAEYGEKMWRYATLGNQVISVSKMAGVVAFPSMHIVLTTMVLWFTRGTYMFIPLLILNLAMPIATVLQGGHHIMEDRKSVV